jgi:YkoY family integral membrane protein
MLAWLPLGQEFAWGDLGLIGLLIVLEGVLSIDNALVLGLLAKRLPKNLQSRALTYGLVGAFAFRVLAIATASFLLKWRVVKLFGGGYLAYVAIKHLWFESGEGDDADITVSPEGEATLVHETTRQPLTPAQVEAEIEQRAPFPLAEDIASDKDRPGGARFWPTVAVIELTDIAFAVDSILAAIALVGPPRKGTPVDAIHPKLWVIILGGVLGVVLMRFAAVIFIKLLEKYPRFESTAYWLVLAIGVKLLADWGFNSKDHPHRVDFHDWRSPAFWIFWLTIAVTFCTGFLPKSKPDKSKG